MNILVNIDVPDLYAAIEFYTAALGLVCVRVIDGDVAELSGCSCRVYLLQNAGGSRPVPGNETARDYLRHWTPVHVDFVVDDLDLAAARAIRAGARRETGTCNWRGSTHVSFSDPFGHGFCLIRFTDETYESDSVI